MYFLQETEVRERALSLRHQMMIGLAVALVAAAGLSSTLDGALRDANERTRSAAKRLDTVIVVALVAIWDRVDQRDGLLRELAARTGSRVEIRDHNGVTIAAAGDARCQSYLMAAVEPHGFVALCDDGAEMKVLAMRVGAPVVAAALVWLIAHALARRLTVPLETLRRTAEIYAAGRLDERADGPSGVYEIEALKNSLHAMADRIRARVETQRDVLAAVSHDLRSPVARLRLLVDLADANVGVDQIAPEMSVEIDLLASLIDNLLASVRLDFQALRVQKCSVPQEVERAAAGRLVACDTAQSIYADPTLLVRALAILIDNAFCHGAAPVSVTMLITSSAQGLCVDDSGKGFAESVLAAAPQPFRRGPKAAGHGVGLGLHLARRIAEAHGGTLQLSNRDGGGGRAIIWFRDLGKQ